MIAFVAADALRDAAPPTRARLAWILGLAGGWAVVTEFQAAIPAVFIGLLAIAWDGLKAVPYERNSIGEDDPRHVGHGPHAVPNRRPSCESPAALPSRPSRS
jgi:hypothetical protein